AEFIDLPCPANYVLTIDQGNPCHPFCDINADGRIDSRDVTAFITAFFAQSPTADYNGDGVVDGQDLTAYLAGCQVTPGLTLSCAAAPSCATIEAEACGTSTNPGCDAPGGA